MGVVGAMAVVWLLDLTIHIVLAVWSVNFSRGIGSGGSVARSSSWGGERTIHWLRPSKLSESQGCKSRDSFQCSVIVSRCRDFTFDRTASQRALIPPPRKAKKGRRRRAEWSRSWSLSQPGWGSGNYHRKVQTLPISKHKFTRPEVSFMQSRGLRAETFLIW